MGAKVNDRFRDMTKADVRIAAVPSGLDWTSAGQNIVYLNAFGSQLIPMTKVENGYAEITPMSSAIFEIPTCPRKATLNQLWIVGTGFNYPPGQDDFEVPSVIQRMTLTFSPNFGDSEAPHYSFVSNTRTFELINREVPDQGAVPKIEFMGLTCSNESAVFRGGIEMIGVWEIPRVELDPNNLDDNAVDPSTLQYNEPIYDDTTAIPRKSANGVLVHCSSSIHTTRRAGIFSYIVPHAFTHSVAGIFNNTELQPFTDTVKSFFVVPPKVQGRRVFKNQQTSSVNVLAQLVGGNGKILEMVLSSTVGTTFIRMTGATGMRWISSSLNILCDGNSGSTFPGTRDTSDSIDFKFRNVTDNTTFRVGSIHVQEKEP